MRLISYKSVLLLNERIGTSMHEEIALVILTSRQFFLNLGSQWDNSSQ